MSPLLLSRKQVLGAATLKLEPPKPYWWLAQTKASLNQTYASLQEENLGTTQSTPLLFYSVSYCLLWPPSLWLLH